MSNRLIVALELLGIAIALVVYSVMIVIPEYKEKLGSSDSFVNAGQYKNMIEIRLDSQTDFALLLNQKGEVYHIFFFDNSSVFLYNKNIENHNLKESMQKILVLLVEHGYWKSDSKVEVIRYGDEFYSEFLATWKDLSFRYSLPEEILEKEVSLEDRALELGIHGESVSAILLDMDFTSKEVVKNAPDIE